MGNCDYQQSIRTGQIVFFLKLKVNGSETRFTKNPKTRAPKKEKKKKKEHQKWKYFLKAGLGFSCSTA